MYKNKDNYYQLPVNGDNIFIGKVYEGLIESRVLYTQQVDGMLALSCLTIIMFIHISSQFESFNFKFEMLLNIHVDGTSFLSDFDCFQYQLSVSWDFSLPPPKKKKKSPKSLDFPLTYLFQMWYVAFSRWDMPVCNRFWLMS